MESATKPATGVSITSDTSEDEILTLTIEGRLDSRTTGKAWREATGILERTSPKRLVVDTSALSYCDGSGIALLLELERKQRDREGEYEIRDFPEEFKQLLELFQTEDLEEEEKEPEETNLPEEVGEATVGIWREISGQISFVGELVMAYVYSIFHPGRVRWKDALLTAEMVGVDALFIIALINFLVGLVMAFQAAIPMKQFGAEIFVADLVALSMFRELGPLMTAIILAGRTGSAFAAELGTMKVNEEIDALTTMGLDPVQFLVVTRVMAVVFMIPILTIFADFFGLVGGGVVMLSLGFPVITYINQILYAASLTDIVGGLFKSLFFGVIVAGIGCFRGLRTKTGAIAVGESATRAVVSGIILIIVVDGIFAVIYYYLGI